MIYKNDNIVLSTEPLIIHGCNCQGRMGSGVARAIRARFPKAYTTYLEVYENHGLTLGQTIFVDCTDRLSSKWVGNCITQQYYGYDNKQYCDYKAIEACLITVKEFCQINNFNSFAMPKIGCGLGGGDWKIVEHIINQIFNSDSIVPIIYDNQSKLPNINQ